MSAGGKQEESFLASFKSKLRQSDIPFVDASAPSAYLAEQVSSLQDKNATQLLDPNPLITIVGPKVRTVVSPPPLLPSPVSLSRTRVIVRGGVFSFTRE